MNKDIALWTRQCIYFQPSKIHRHNRAALDFFNTPDERFSHINSDIVGPLPPSNGYRYLLTIIDRFSRWPEAIPSQPRLFPMHYSKIGFAALKFDKKLQHIKVDSSNLNTTAYHPQSNGTIERFHRTLKAALMTKPTKNWARELPLIMLGFRCTFK